MLSICFLWGKPEQVPPSIIAGWFGGPLHWIRSSRHEPWTVTTRMETTCTHRPVSLS